MFESKEEKTIKEEEKLRRQIQDLEITAKDEWKHSVCSAKTEEKIKEKRQKLEEITKIIQHRKN